MIKIPMKVVRDNCIPDIVAKCGSACSCVTCHVHLPDNRLDRVPAITPIEGDMLDLPFNAPRTRTAFPATTRAVHSHASFSAWQEEKHDLRPQRGPV